MLQFFSELEFDIGLDLIDTDLHGLPALSGPTSCAASFPSSHRSALRRSAFVPGLPFGFPDKIDAERRKHEEPSDQPGGGQRSSPACPGEQVIGDRAARHDKMPPQDQKVGMNKVNAEGAGSEGKQYFLKSRFPFQDSNEQHQKYTRNAAVGVIRYKVDVG